MSKEFVKLNNTQKKLLKAKVRTELKQAKERIYDYIDKVL